MFNFVYNHNYLTSDNILIMLVKLINEKKKIFQTKDFSFKSYATKKYLKECLIYLLGIPVCNIKQDR